MFDDDDEGEIVERKNNNNKNKKNITKNKTKFKHLKTGLINLDS